MTRLERRLAPHGAPPPPFFVAGALRGLALVDAVAVPALLLYWVWSWPGQHGGFVGAITATLLVGWGLRRARRAVFGFDRYRWMARHVARLVLMGLILQLIVGLQGT